MALTDTEWEELAECCTTPMYRSLLREFDDLNQEIRRLRASAVGANVGAEIDALAYRFWSLHPKELDRLPPRPEWDNRGGKRAAYYADEMRKLFARHGVGVNVGADETTAEKSANIAID